MPRRPGRPQKEMEQLDVALSAFGGVRSVTQNLDRQRKTLGEIAAELERLGGIRVTISTISNWLSRWAAESQESKETVAA